MIAEAVRTNCANHVMADVSKPSDKENSAPEEETGGAAPPPKQPSPAPTNGDVNHKDHVTPQVQTGSPGINQTLSLSATSGTSQTGATPSGASQLSSGANQLPLTPSSGDAHSDAKEEEDGHMSSEDEDKLVINEGCEKKELSRNEASAEGPDSVEAGRSPSDGSGSSPKSPFKRSVEDVEAAAVETLPKKARVYHELPSDLSPASPQVAQLDETLVALRNDLKGLEFLLVQKEEEWNSILHLMKKKEELYLRLLRKRQVLKIVGKKAVEGQEDCEEEEEESVMFLPQGVYSSLGSSRFPYMMMKHMLADQFMPQVPSAPYRYHEKKHSSSSSNGPVTSQGNISVIDIHTSNTRTSGASDLPQISISPETHSKLGKHLNSVSVKPILPKPLSSGGGIGSSQSGGSLPPLSCNFPTGFGPQGPTISVHHLIAAHRKENPHIPPIRGAKRGAWRHRYESEKRSSSREPDRPSSVSSSNSETEMRVNPTMVSANATLNTKNVASLSSSSSPATPNSMLPMNDPSVSYKDVLLQFAQLTQTEKRPGSPQISIIPVSVGDSSSRKESAPDSTSATILREVPIPPQTSTQSQNLEGSSALAKLLLESGAGNHGSAAKGSAVDLTSYNNSPHCLTLSALLSGGTTTTLKEKSSSSSSQMDSSRSKKSATEESNSNPKCQGCQRQRAQFVCAGCGNQWYCSRNCQVTAWEKHSEHCNS